MSNNDTVKLEGKVIDNLPSLSFRVELPNRSKIIATLCGKMRKSRRESLKIMKGDTVIVELSIHDLSIGRIVYRYPRQRVQISPA